MLHVRNAHGMHHSPEWPESCVFISIDELLPAAREYGEAHTSRSHGVVAGMAPDGPSASPAPNKAAPIAKWTPPDSRTERLDPPALTTGGIAQSSASCC